MLPTGDGAAPFARAFARRFSNGKGQELPAHFTPLRAGLAVEEGHALSALRKQALRQCGLTWAEVVAKSLIAHCEAEAREYAASAVVILSVVCRAWARRCSARACGRGIDWQTAFGCKAQGLPLPCTRSERSALLLRRCPRSSRRSPSAGTAPARAPPSARRPAPSPSSARSASPAGCTPAPPACTQPMS